MKNVRYMITLLAAFLVAWSASALSWPLDGYEETGIRRVEGARLAHLGEAKGGFQPPGALLPTEQVDIRLENHPDLGLPEADAGFTGEITDLLGGYADRYGMAVLDLTNPDEPRYAEHRGDYLQNVGSVGKLLVALGFFQALADAWPDDPEKREAILRDTVVTADGFSQSDHHTIRIFNVETRELTRRPMAVGDQGSLWEFLDWTLSVSSNSAAAMTMREAMLLSQYGKDYPPSEA